jgi:hypothetical protein
VYHSSVKSGLRPEQEYAGAVAMTEKHEPAHFLPVSLDPEMPRVYEFIIFWAYTLMPES